MNGDQTTVYYTGIGARETPPQILEIIEKIAIHMALRGCILRSGGAAGASCSFEKGCGSAKGTMMIFLPWRGFNGNNSTLYTIPDLAYLIVKDFNPAWNTLSESSKKLQSRYALTVLGQQLKEPSACVICYTKGGKQKGGTGQALRIAAKYKVPVFNIGLHEGDPAALKEKLAEFLTGLNLSAEGLTI